jgi:hypothetical protein
LRIRWFAGASYRLPATGYPRMMINVNGRITGGQDAVISVLDHGFLYGEGVY